MHHVISSRRSAGRARPSGLTAPVAAVVALVVALTGLLALGLAAPASADGGSVVNRLQPTISGTAQVGKTLTLDKGVWSPTGTTLTVQWLRNGVAIADATADTYLLAPADAGTSVSARVTGSMAGLTTAMATSAQAVVVDVCGELDLLCALNPPRPKSSPSGGQAAITGDVQVGSTLTADEGDWTPAGVTYLYQWYADGAVIDGANAKTFALTSSQQGARIKVKVYATANGLSGSDESDPTVAVAADPNDRHFTLLQKPLIIDTTPQVGDTMLATNGAWEPEPTGFAHQWRTHGPEGVVVVATTDTLLVTPAMVGKTISVRVTAKAQGRDDTAGESAQTGPVTAAAVDPNDPDQTKADPMVRVKVKGTADGDVVVKARVTATGVSPVTGQVRFKVTRGGGKAELVTLTKGKAKVVLKNLRNGKHKAKVRYLGSSKVGKSVKVVVPFATF